MTHLTKEEEDIIDAGEDVIKLDRGKTKFKVDRKNIYCYGEIDFNDDSEDYEFLASKDWFRSDMLHGIPVPTKYNYKQNVIVSDIKGGRWYDTFYTEVICQFKHGQLGKPDRTIIFKIIG